jgi:hypothetical protein
MAVTALDRYNVAVAPDIKGVIAIYTLKPQKKSPLLYETVITAIPQ